MNPLLLPLIEGAKTIIGNLVGGKLKKEEAEAELAVLVATTDLELKKVQADVIKAEAQGASWLQRNWRPLLMLDFAGLITARWLGYTAPNLTPDLELQLLEIVKIGVGGYVIGRSAEKIAPSIAEAMRGKK